MMQKHSHIVIFLGGLVHNAKRRKRTMHSSASLSFVVLLQCNCAKRTTTWECSHVVIFLGFITAWCRTQRGRQQRWCIWMHHCHLFFCCNTNKTTKRECSHIVFVFFWLQFYTKHEEEEDDMLKRVIIIDCFVVV